MKQIQVGNTQYHTPFTLMATKRGDYLLCVNGNQQAVRFATLEEGTEYINALAERNRIEAEAGARLRALREEFDRSVPSLNQRQLKWQEWRREFFDRLQFRLRNAGRAERFGMVGIQRAYNDHTREQALNRLDELISEAYRMEEAYSVIARLDAEIKRARRERDVAALEQALVCAERAMVEYEWFMI